MIMKPMIAYAQSKVPKEGEFKSGSYWPVFRCEVGLTLTIYRWSVGLPFQQNPMLGICHANSYGQAWADMGLSIRNCNPSFMLLPFCKGFFTSMGSRFKMSMREFCLQNNSQKCLMARFVHNVMLPWCQNMAAVPILGRVILKMIGMITVQIFHRFRIQMPKCPNSEAIGFRIR